MKALMNSGIHDPQMEMGSRNRPLAEPISFRLDVEVAVL